MRGLPGSEGLYAAVSLLLLLLLWQFLSTVLKLPSVPAPNEVLAALADELAAGRLPTHLAATLRRLGLSFGIAMVLGTALGLALGRLLWLDRWLSSWLVVFLNIPALVTIILCYVWFGLSEAAAILAVVVNKLPNVVVTIREGARALDRDLMEMAEAYRFSRWRLFRHVIWPQLFPFVMTAARTGLALIWKIILVVELLGLSNGMGYQIHLYFQMFDVARILAYSVAFVAVMQAVEWLVLHPLDRAARRWRR